MSFGHHNEHNKRSFYSERKEPESVIPTDILQVFEETDIDKVWETLDRVFHLNVKYWKPRFESAYKKSPHELSKMEVFFRYGRANFEKSINTLRGNQEYAHTFEKIVRYVIQAKIDEKKKSAEFMKNKFGVSSYYKVTNKKY